MKEFLPYLPTAIALGIILLIVLICYWYKQRKTQNTRAQVCSLIEHKIGEAQSQRELFNVEILDENNKDHGFTGTLQQFSKGLLVFEVLTTIPPRIKGLPVCVYFRLKNNAEQHYFKFTSSIESITSQNGISSISLRLPDHLEAGQKRNFFRISPPLTDIRALGLWPLNAQQPMPETTGNVRTPLRVYKAGMKERQIMLEDISASGLGIRAKNRVPKLPDLDIHAHEQLMIVIAYTINNVLTTFWCTGEVVNVRPASDGETTTYGIEFTNWAELKPGQQHFHWAHASPVRGVTLIHNWVDSLDRNKIARHV